MNFVTMSSPSSLKSRLTSPLVLNPPFVCDQVKSETSSVPSASMPVKVPVPSSFSARIHTFPSRSPSSPAKDSESAVQDPRYLLSERSSFPPPQAANANVSTIATLNSIASFFFMLQPSLKIGKAPISSIYTIPEVHHIINVYVSILRHKNSRRDPGAFMIRI